MKKIILLSATLLLCAGMAFAQAPKKPAPKAAPEKTVTTKAEAKSQTPSAAKQSSCGNCPHHKQCANNAQAVAKPEAAPKSCCNKEGKQPAAPKKNVEEKAAVTK